MNVPSHIFRQYDIRGIVGQDFGADITEAVGRAYGTVLRGRVTDRTPHVVCGGDNRPSSPGLVEGLVAGLRAAGVDVTTLGTVPTPVTYWAERSLGSDGAIQVTGSHNPPEWNGIKMTMLGRPFFGDAVTGLRERIVAGEFSSGDGQAREASVLDSYVEDIRGRFDLARPVKVAVDCGNGTGAVVAVELLEAIGAEVIPLYCESDGTFPNHHPDPSVDETLDDLIRAVEEQGAELGVAFDGDADRIGAVDGRGRIIRGDELMLVYGLDLLAQRGPGQLLVYDVKCSQVLPEVYEEAGGKTIMWKTGHSFMKEKMRETGAAMGGELSGHIYFADGYLGIDDALYAACRLVALVARSEEALDETIDRFPKYVSTPEIRIEVAEEDKQGLIGAALAHFSSDHEVVDVDGVRVLFGDGWGLLRASNTQPVLVARFEAKSPERLEEIRRAFEDWLASQGVDV